MVNALSLGAKERSQTGFIARILLLAAVAYLIIKSLGINVAVAATGLLVLAAAVLVELVYQLIYTNP